MAAARVLAARDDTPLYGHLRAPEVELRLPVPHFNLLNGGAHAANRVEFQECMVAPVDAVRAGAESYAALRARLRDTGLATGLGDEGGFARSRLTRHRLGQRRRGVGPVNRPSKWSAVLGWNGRLRLGNHRCRALGDNRRRVVGAGWLSGPNRTVNTGGDSTRTPLPTRAGSACL
jgi:hypothetical protein